MNDYQLVPLISPEEIQRRLDELAIQINKDYEGGELVVVGILKGAFVFVADLVRRLCMPVQVEFVRLASYGTRADSSGAIQITKDVELSLQGCNVLVVEDIVDTGTTLSWFLEHLQNKHEPASVRICTLVDKFERRVVDIKPDYVGISMDKGFIVGYGLDFSEKHRNLSGIYEVRFLE